MTRGSKDTKSWSNAAGEIPVMALKQANWVMPSASSRTSASTRARPGACFSVPLGLYISHQLGSGGHCSFVGIRDPCGMRSTNTTRWDKESRRYGRGRRPGELSSWFSVCKLAEPSCSRSQQDALRHICERLEGLER